MWWLKWWPKNSYQNSERESRSSSWYPPLLKEKYIWKSSSSFILKVIFTFLLTSFQWGITGDNGYSVLYLMLKVKAKIGKHITDDVMWSQSLLKWGERAHRLRHVSQGTLLGNLEPVFHFLTSLQRDFHIIQACHWIITVSSNPWPNQFIIYSAREIFGSLHPILCCGPEKLKGLLIAVKFFWPQSYSLLGVSQSAVQLGTFIGIYLSARSSKALLLASSVSTKENGGFSQGDCVLCILWCYFIIEVAPFAYYKGKGKRIRSCVWGNIFLNLRLSVKITVITNVLIWCCLNSPLTDLHSQVQLQ